MSIVPQIESRLLQKKGILDQYITTQPKGAFEAIVWLEGFIEDEFLSGALGIDIQGPGVASIRRIVSRVKYCYAIGQPPQDKDLRRLFKIERFLMADLKRYAVAGSEIIANMFQQVFSVFENEKISAQHTINDMSGMPSMAPQNMIPAANFSSGVNKPSGRSIPLPQKKEN